VSLPYNNFFGSLNGKTITDFTNQLDYKITKQEERVELVNKIVNTEHVGESDLPDKFFEEYFEQKDNEDGINKSHIKLCSTTKDNLSDKSSVCKSLERMADYILYAPDGEKINKKTEYNFYKEEEFNKIINNQYKNMHIEDLNLGNKTQDEVIDYLVRKGENYKKENKQKIYVKDFLNKDYGEILLSYQRIIDDSKDKLKRIQSGELKLEYTNAFKISGMIKSLKQDLIDIKTQLSGAIYFKQPLLDSTEIDYEQFDFFNPEHVLILLSINKKNDLTNDLACMTQDLDDLLKECYLSDNEKMIIKLYREYECDLTSISKSMGVTYQNIQRVLMKIVNKVINAYENKLEDWYYLNIVKAKYKTCSKCGKIYIANERHFSKMNGTRDGFRPNCKHCDNI
jgi:hypothetical protein